MHATVQKKYYSFAFFIILAGEMERMGGQDLGELYSSPDSAILSLRPWANQLTFLSPSFLLCKMGITVIACDLTKLCRVSDGIVGLVLINEGLTLSITHQCFPIPTSLSLMMSLCPASSFLFGLKF